MEPTLEGAADSTQQKTTLNFQKKSKKKINKLFFGNNTIEKNLLATVLPP